MNCKNCGAVVPDVFRLQRDKKCRECHNLNRYGKPQDTVTEYRVGSRWLIGGKIATVRGVSTFYGVRIRCEVEGKPRMFSPVRMRAEATRLES